MNIRASSEFCESFLCIFKPEGGLGTSDVVVVSETRAVWCGVLPTLVVSPLKTSPPPSSAPLMGSFFSQQDHPNEHQTSKLKIQDATKPPNTA